MENVNYFLLIVSAFLCCAGILTVITKKNSIAILLGIELIINAGLLNFYVFGLATGTASTSSMFILFGIILAAAGAAVALAIVLNVFQKLRTIDPQKMDTLKN